MRDSERASCADDGIEEDGGVEEDEKKTGSEGRQRLQRERRHRSSSGGGGGAMPGNVDLLMIPGVGPRNLRKLVDKGIGGVAELKQLYRDKVIDWIFSLIVDCACFLVLSVPLCLLEKMLRLSKIARDIGDGIVANCGLICS